MTIPFIDPTSTSNQERSAFLREQHDKERREKSQRNHIDPCSPPPHTPGTTPDSFILPSTAPATAPCTPGSTLGATDYFKSIVDPLNQVLMAGETYIEEVPDEDGIVYGRKGVQFVDGIRYFDGEATGLEGSIRRLAVRKTYPVFPIKKSDSAFACFVNPRVSLGSGGRWSTSSVLHMNSCDLLFKKLIPVSEGSPFACKGFNQMENVYTGMRDRLTSFTEWRFEQVNSTLSQRIYALNKLFLADPEFLANTFEPLHNLSPSHISAFFRGPHAMNHENWTLQNLNTLMRPLDGANGADREKLGGISTNCRADREEFIHTPAAGADVNKKHTSCRDQADFYALASEHHHLFGTLENMVAPSVKNRTTFANHMWMVDAVRLVMMDDFHHSGHMKLFLGGMGKNGTLYEAPVSSAVKKIRRTKLHNPIHKTNFNNFIRGEPLEDIFAGDFGDVDGFVDKSIGVGVDGFVGEGMDNIGVLEGIDSISVLEGMDNIGVGEGMDNIGVLEGIDSISVLEGMDNIGVGEAMDNIGVLEAMDDINYRRFLMSYTYTLDTIHAKPLTAWRIKDADRFNEIMRVLGAHGDPYNRDLILRYFGMYPAQEPKELAAAYKNPHKYNAPSENIQDPRDAFYEYTTKIKEK